jgi:phosphatidylserine/phosphatidylglycerophosphate/cardiolipin synthase-like enzyme
MAEVKEKSEKEAGDSHETEKIYQVVVLATILDIQRTDSQKKQKKQDDRAIIRLIDGADQYAYFAVYTFTKTNIADALVRAKRRGIDVQGITDLEQSQISEEAAVLQKLRAAGIPVETQKHQEGIMHVKALITDRAYAAGSFNWTWSATNVNDEVLEIGNDENVRMQYFTVVKKLLNVNR